MNVHTSHFVALIADALLQGQIVTLKVVSGSMYPVLRVGDRVFVEFVTPTSLHIGDIVVLSTDEELLTHRFLGWHNGMLLTKGDAISIADVYRHPPRLLGRVIGYERDGVYHDWRTVRARWGHFWLGQLGLQ